MFEDKGTTRAHGIFALNHSHVSLVWTAPPSVVQNQLADMCPILKLCPHA